MLTLNLVPAMSQKNLLNPPSGSSWWAAFSVENERGFSGSITHIHLADPGDLDEIAADALAVASKLGMISGGLDVAAIAWQLVAPNNDGSYDFYIIRGTKYMSTGQKTIPVYLDFVGFVSDSWWRIPLNIKKPISNVIHDSEKVIVVVMGGLQDSNKLIPVAGQLVMGKLVEKVTEPLQIIIEINCAKQVANDFRTYIQDPDFSTSWYETIK